jgi:hypothetical protein
MTDDELDRALFNLPLAEPPAGLRASILASTIYAPRAMMRSWETIGIGVALALLAWMVVGFATDGALAKAFAAPFASQLVAALSNTTTLIWLSCGAAIAALSGLFDPRTAISRRS